jgi:hypothetical protein
VKQRWPIISTDEGTQIDWSDEHSANAAGPKFESLVPDSNATADSFVQHLKQESAITLIDEGTQIDCSDEHFANAPLPSVESVEADSNETINRLRQS